jgi:hypothetical protein
MNHIQEPEFSPEQDTATYHKQLFEAITLQLGVMSEELPATNRISDRYSSFQPEDHVTFINTSHDHALAQVGDRSTLLTGGEGTVQSLHAVIQAGGELFGVVEAVSYKDREEDEGYYKQQTDMLVRFGAKGEPATVVAGFGSGRALEVGRTTKNGFSPTTSHKHFSIRSVSTGNIRIDDLDSTNHTTVAYTVEAEHEGLRNRRVTDKSKFGLNSLKKRLKQPANPLEDTDSWMVSEEDIKKADLEDRRSLIPR